MGILKEWELREETRGGEALFYQLWLNRDDDGWLQCCYIILYNEGNADFASVPTLDKQLIADLSWVCYQIEGGKKRGRLR